MNITNPNEIIENFDEEERIPNKKHKKKPRPKKSDHKHIYDKILIVEEAPDYLKYFENKITYRSYKKCSICGRLDDERLPDYIIDDLVKTFNKNPLNARFFYCHVDNRKEAEYLKNKYPELIEVKYIEK